MNLTFFNFSLIPSYHSGISAFVSFCLTFCTAFLIPFLSSASFSCLKATVSCPALGSKFTLLLRDYLFTMINLKVCSVYFCLTSALGAANVVVISLNKLYYIPFNHE